MCRGLFSSYLVFPLLKAAHAHGTTSPRFTQQQQQRVAANHSVGQQQQNNSTDSVLITVSSTGNEMEIRGYQNSENGENT